MCLPTTINSNKIFNLCLSFFYGLFYSSLQLCRYHLSWKCERRSIYNILLFSFIMPTNIYDGHFTFFFTKLFFAFFIIFVGGKTADMTWAAVNKKPFCSTPSPRFRIKEMKRKLKMTHHLQRTSESSCKSCSGSVVAK